MPEQVSKVVKYKEGRWAGNARANLFVRLSNALQNAPKIGERLQPVSSDGRTQRAINTSRAFRGGLGGSLIEWTNGEGSALINNFDPNATELDIATLESNDRRKFLQAMAFFYVRANHVVLITSPVLTDGRIQDYFNWLLDQTGANNPTITLLDAAPSRGDARALLQNVKSITLNPTPTINDSSVQTLGTALRGDILVDILARLKELGGKGIKEASLSRALASENVRATIQIRYSGRMPVDGVPLLDEVARAVSEIADEGYTIEVPSRGQLRPGDFRIRDRRSVQARDGHPEAGPAIDVMSAWLDELVESGVVVD